MAGVHEASAKTLIIGDSHTCGAFGDHLAKGLSREDHVVVYCAVSSTSTDWIRGRTPRNQTCYRRESPGFQKKPCDGTGKVPPAESLITREKPDDVVIALGTNSLGSSSATADDERLARLAGRRCHWMGPPWLNPSQARGFSTARLEAMNANVDGYYRSLSQKVSPHCRLHDSRPSTRAGQAGHETIDGVHRGERAGAAWAAALLQSRSTSLGLDDLVHIPVPTARP